MSRSKDGKKGYEASKEKLDAYKQEKSRAAREAYEADPKICPACDRVLPYEERRNKFCNKSCAASYNNRGVTRHAAHPENCAHCGKRKEKRHNTYCDECIANGVYIKKLHRLSRLKTIRHAGRFCWSNADGAAKNAALPSGEVSQLQLNLTILMAILITIPPKICA
jgi:hypothetical protein